MAPEQKKPGYDDTPFLPDGKYRVHDSNRPQPRIVAPGTASTQEKPGAPPSDAVVLFDGTSLAGWASMDGSPAKWKLEGGYMEVVPRTGSIQSREAFGDCQLHVEWAAPSLVKGESQGAGKRRQAGPKINAPCEAARWISRGLGSRWLAASRSGRSSSARPAYGRRG